MILYYDISLKTLRLKDGFDPVASMRIWYPSREDITVNLESNGASYSAPAGSTLVVGVKDRSALTTAGFLASVTFTSFSGSSATATLNTNTTAMVAFMGTTQDARATSFVIALLQADSDEYPLTLPCTVAPSIYNGGEDPTTETASLLATQSEAEAGVSNTKWMSPLRTAQAIAAQAALASNGNVIIQGSGGVTYELTAPGGILTLTQI